MSQAQATHAEATHAEATHAEPAHAERSSAPLPTSIMGAPALWRVAAVAAGLSLLWLCVLWAISLP